MDTQPSISKFNLSMGDRYTFYLYDGRMIRGTFDEYIFWGGPNKGIKISDYVETLPNTKQFEREDGTRHLGLVDITKVTKFNGTDIAESIEFSGGRKYRKSRKYKKLRQTKKSKKVKTRRLKYKRM